MGNASSEQTNPSAYEFRPVTGATASGLTAATNEIPILYLATHGVFDVRTDDKQVEVDPIYLSLPIEIPRDMTILKFNFVPINVCNYGGSGDNVFTTNVADYVHHVISDQLNPEIIMARKGFEYFLLGDSKTTRVIVNSGLRDSLEEYRGRKFIDVPLDQFHKVLYDVAISQGLSEAIVLDTIMNELHDSEVNDSATRDNELTGREKESVMRGNNIKRRNAMMMQIIDESVKKAVKHIKGEVTQSLTADERKLERLRENYLHPRLRTIPEYETRYADSVAIFNETDLVSGLMQGINNAKAYINKVDDLAKSSNWNISIPNKSGKPRYILNKTFVLQPQDKTNGLDWNITMFKPKTGIVEDIFTGLNPENKKPDTDRKMTLSEILAYLHSVGVKTVILLDETCSGFRAIMPDESISNVDARTAMRWANRIKYLNERDYAMYGGKRKKNKKHRNTKISKNTKTKKQKTQKTKNYKK